MNNDDENQLALLLYETELKVELLSWFGGVLSTYRYDFTVYFPSVQKLMCGKDDLDAFDGIHQIDEDTYCGVGSTLKEAWDDFYSKNEDFLCNLGMYDQDEWADVFSGYLIELKAKHEL